MFYRACLCSAYSLQRNQSADKERAPHNAQKRDEKKALNVHFIVENCELALMLTQGAQFRTLLFSTMLGLAGFVLKGKP